MQTQSIQECFEIAELREILQQSAGAVTLIDVRNLEEYNELHIPGAISIPLGELQQRLNELPKEKPLISVCGKGGGRSEQAATLLKQNGFRNSYWLCGGTFGWFEK